MEEKYRKLAVDLGIKVVEDKAVEDNNRWQEKYYQREISRLELQTKMLIKTICDQREYIDTLEDIKNEYDSKVIELRKEIVKRDEEIETLKKIIDKCNRTYYNANEKTEVEENKFEDTTCFSYKDTGYGISFVHSINDLLLDLIKDDLVYFDKNNNIIYDGEVVGKLGENLYKTMKKISESDPDTLQMVEENEND